MEIKKIELDFSVCKVEDFSEVNFNDDFVFVGKTEEEKSVVCNTLCIPKNTIACESGWKCFRIQGVLDFSLVGILAKISTLLADNSIALYAISTYNTDYILVKKEQYENSLAILSQNGYTLV